jgi:hypothetical protein
MRIAPALALTIAAALSLGACQQQHTPIVPSPAPSATPIFASDDEALAAAEEAYRAYLRVLDEIYADSGADPERLLEVASEPVFQKELPSFEETQADGSKSVGQTKFDSMSLQSFDGLKKLDAVVVYVCEDFSATDILNASGVSIVSPTRQTRWPLTVAFDFTPRPSSPLIVSEISDWTGQDFCAD